MVPALSKMALVSERVPAVASAEIRPLLMSPAETMPAPERARVTMVGGSVRVPAPVIWGMAVPVKRMVPVPPMVCDLLQPYRPVRL